ARKGMPRVRDRPPPSAEANLDRRHPTSGKHPTSLAATLVRPREIGEADRGIVEPFQPAAPPLPGPRMRLAVGKALIIKRGAEVFCWAPGKGIDGEKIENRRAASKQRMDEAREPRTLRRRAVARHPDLPIEPWLIGDAPAQRLRRRSREIAKLVAAPGCAIIRSFEDDGRS